MKSYFKIMVWITALLMLAAIGAWYWNGLPARSPAFPRSLAALGRIHDGWISFEEKHGEMFVHVTDRYQDGHIHRLDHRGTSREQALERLETKQDELPQHAAQHVSSEQAEPIGIEWMRKEYGNDSAQGIHPPYAVIDGGDHWMVIASSVEGTGDGISVMVDTKTGEAKPEPLTH